MALISSSRSRSSQGQGYLKVMFIPELNGKCLDLYPEAGNGPSSECILVVIVIMISADFQLNLNFVLLPVFTNVMAYRE